MSEEEENGASKALGIVSAIIAVVVGLYALSILF